MPSRVPSDPAEDGEEESTALPDWLSTWANGGQSFEPVEHEEVEPGKPSTDRRRALSDSDLETPDDTTHFNLDALPDWLRVGAETVDATTDTSEIERQSASAASTLPDWLAEIAERDSVSDEPTEVGYRGVDDDYDQEDLPEWLRQTVGTQSDVVEDGEAEQYAEDEEVVSEVDPLIFSEAELPEWLQGLSDEDESASALPQWLTDLAPGTSESQAPGVEAASAEAPSDPTSAPREAEQPALWIEADDELSPSEAELADALPDWLAGLALAQADQQGVVGEDLPARTTTKPTSVFAEDPAEETEQRALSPLDEGPAWLRGLRDKEESSEKQPTPSVFVDQERSQEAAGLTTDDQPQALAAEEAEEIPEWLYSLEVTSTTPSAVSPFEPDVAEMSPLAPAELPPWLEALAPPDASRPVDLFGAMGTGMPGAVRPRGHADDLIPADIPDWIERLRPDPRDAGQPSTHDHAVLPTPAEPEGPLQGLPGVLPSLSIVDMPPDAQPSRSLQLSEATEVHARVVAQAELWQQLLEQPRSAERPVAQQHPRRAPSLRLVRLCVAALMVIGIFAAFWLVPDNMRLPFSQTSITMPSAQGPSAVAALIERLDQLEPGARVILAIEYTPAYADEMSQIAAPILEHLNARDAEVVMVSTLPEGMGLATALTPQPRNRLLLTNEGYLAGNASGIAVFLSRQESQTAQHLVILASDPLRFGWWIEQSTLSNHQRNDPKLSISAGVSAATGPLVRPYLESNLVAGSIVGFPQAMAYRDVREIGSAAQRSDRASAYLNILTLAHWMVAAVLLIAWIYNLIDRKGEG